MTEGKKSFWETLPGILTGLAAVITAIGGVLALFLKTIDHKTTEPRPIVEVSENGSQERRQTVPVSRKRIPRNQSDEEYEEEIVPNVAGMWKDAYYGAVVQVVQNGARVQTQTTNPFTGQQLAQGYGVINGNQIEGPYQAYDGTRYTAKLTLSKDGNHIRGNWRNIATNETGPVHLTR